MPDSAYIRLSDLPNDLSQRLEVFFKQHNILVDKVVLIKEDLESITGKTPEEKTEVKQAWAIARPLIHLVKSKGLLGLLGSWIVLQILQSLGIQTRLLAPLIEKFMGQ